MASLCKNAFAFNPRINNLNILIPRNCTSVLQPCASISSRKLEARLELPEKPRRPLTAFFRFAQETRPTLISQYPDMNLTEMQKKIGELWKTCDPAEKDRLIAAYKAEYPDYNNKMKEYTESLTESQKMLLHEEKNKNAEAKKKHDKKKEMSKLGRPKKSPTAFILYMQSRQSEKPKDVPVTEWSKTVGSDWKALSLKNKKKFVDEAAKLKAEWDYEMSLWETEMLQKGHIDFLRKHVRENLTINPKFTNENIPTD